MFTATRYHDICAGHRVHGHENKCAHLHGHNYRIWFHCRGDLDGVGRVLDFSAIKARLCDWLESNWDHRFLYWEGDPQCSWLHDAADRKAKQMAYAADANWDRMGLSSFVRVPFNPTAENMARYLVKAIGPQQLEGTGIELYKVVVEETAKCHASYELPQPVVYSSDGQGGGYRQLVGAGTPMKIGGEEDLAPWEDPDQ